MTVEAEECVPGDLGLCDAGDRVPADVRLGRLRNLQIQEAVLTGESAPVEKSVEPVAADASLGDQSPVAFPGTLVTAGPATGAVVPTGAWTELGRITQLLDPVNTLTPPFLRRMHTFPNWPPGALPLVTPAVSTWPLAFR